MKKALISAWLFAAFQASASPDVGQSAPDFSLQGSDGNTYTLNEFRGTKGVVIAFFPKAFTGG